MIDRLIMEAVFRDEKALAVTTLKPKFLVGTGAWGMHEIDSYTYIVFTDEFISNDKAFSALLLEDCELVEGENLVMFTSVAMDEFEYSLVLFKDKAKPEDSDEVDIG